jgi:hypothetical protein
MSHKKPYFLNFFQKTIPYIKITRMGSFLKKKFVKIFSKKRFFGGSPCNDPTAFSTGVLVATPTNESVFNGVEIEFNLGNGNGFLAKIGIKQQQQKTHNKIHSLRVTGISF